MSQFYEQHYQSVISLLAAANALSVKAFNAKSPKNLQFIILNDTLHFLPYDRAFLWRLVDHRPTLLGVSGQATFTAASEIVNRLQTLISGIEKPQEIQILSEESFPKQREEWLQLQTKTPSSVFWAPLVVDEKEIIALWLEKWDDPQSTHFSKERVKAFEDYLIPGYAAAWRKNFSKMNWQKARTFFTKRNLSYAGALLLSVLLLVRVPLRVAAPCEVVSQDPFVITAPLEGIIKQIEVKHGQLVKIGDILYTYDPRIPLQELKIAEKQVELAQSELQRSVAAGYTEDRSLAELTSLKIKLQKARLDLEYTQARTRLLIGKTPVAGVLEISNSDDWRGKPVKVGEKILSISDPDQTKVKMWIPENDNIDLDPEIPIKIFLNPNPEKTYHANLSYLSSETVITEKHIPSFVAEANWENPDEVHAKLGSKGTAILYGEKVSLFYYIMRKPIATLRNLFEI